MINKRRKTFNDKAEKQCLDQAYSYINELEDLILVQLDLLEKIYSGVPHYNLKMIGPINRSKKVLKEL